MRTPSSPRRMPACFQPMQRLSRRCNRRSLGRMLDRTVSDNLCFAIKWRASFCRKNRSQHCQPLRNERNRNECDHCCTFHVPRSYQIAKAWQENSRVLVIPLKCDIVTSQLLGVCEIESLASPKALGPALRLRVIQNDRAWKPFNFLRFDASIWRSRVSDYFSPPMPPVFAKATAWWTSDFG